MDGFTFNKIAGAVLGAALIGFLIIEVSHALYPNPRHAAHVAQMGYPVADAHASEDGHGGGDAVEEEGPDLATLLAAADPARGESASRACVSCHTFVEGGANGTGPNLWEIVGRPVASHEGYTRYSSAMQEFGGNWTFERLDAFLQSPRNTVPGTGMSFGGIRRDSQRADLLAYLRTLSNNPVPLPTPAPAAAPAEEDHSAPAEDHAAPAEDHGDAMDEAGDAAEGAMDDANDAAEGAMDDAAEMAEDAGEAVADEADEAVDTMEDAADDAADDMEDHSGTTE